MSASTTVPVTLPSSVVARATVHRVERLSPSFLRVVLAAPEFVDLGTEAGDTDFLDARFKVVFPGPTGRLPELPEDPDRWYEAWSSMPADERAPMRTYTVRDVLVEGPPGDLQVLLVVDFVLHGEGPAGQPGPAARWAASAVPGDAVVVAAPRRGAAWGGTEFAPAERRDLLLVGDETAVPALASILCSLADRADEGFTGSVFVEVSSERDLLEMSPPDGIEVHWVFRGDAPYGRPLAAAVRRHLGLGPLDPDEFVPEAPSSMDVEVWETPAFSSAGEDVATQLARRSLGHDLADTYAWIAGESWMVKVLRRALVTELGMDRGQVAFMGYWREGVSMRS